MDRWMVVIGVAAMIFATLIAYWMAGTECPKPIRLGSVWDLGGC
jgi:hypothetical protein